MSTARRNRCEPLWKSDFEQRVFDGPYPGGEAIYRDVTGRHLAPPETTTGLRIAP